MLAVACMIAVAALMLQVRGHEQVFLAFFPELTLPPLCMSREWFGVSCPGCGLTRSFIYLAQGDWLASWQVHRLGWLLAAAVILQIPYRCYRLFRPAMTPRAVRLSRWFGRCLISLLVGNWLFELVWNTLQGAVPGN